MKLLDLLFQGPVKVTDLDHEQYGEVAQMLREEMVVLEDEAIYLTVEGILYLFDVTLQELKKKGLVEQFGDEWVVTDVGIMVFEGSDHVM